MKLIRILLTATLLSSPLLMAAAAQPSKPMKFRSDAGLRFIGEQDGEFEKKIKTKLSNVLRGHPEIQRAYLVSAIYPDSTTTVVLGLVCDLGFSQSVLLDVQTNFAAIAPANLPLDIAFLSPEQQAQVAAVAKPFYVGP